MRAVPLTRGGLGTGVASGRDTSTARVSEVDFEEVEEEEEEKEDDEEEEEDDEEEEDEEGWGCEIEEAD